MNLDNISKPQVNEHILKGQRFKNISTIFKIGFPLILLWGIPIIIVSIAFNKNIFLFVGIFLVVVAFFSFFLGEWFEKKAKSEGIIFENKKNSILAGFLSFLYMGLGQVYNGQFVKGLIIFSLAALFYSLNPLISTIPAFIVIIYSIYDAYSIAKKMNTEQITFQKEQTKDFFIFIVLSIILGILIFMSIFTLFPEL